MLRAKVENNKEIFIANETHSYISRFVPGADDVIAFNCDDNIYELEERDLLLKELATRKPYDVIFLTTTSTYNRDFIWKFLTENGAVIDTDEKPFASDDYGIFMRFLCSVCMLQLNLLSPLVRLNSIPIPFIHRYT